MIALNDYICDDVTTPGGTERIDSYYEIGLTTAAIASAEFDEQGISEYENGQELIELEKLGAVIGWRYSRFRGWGLCVKYWRSKTSQFNYEKTIIPFVVEFTSGFV